MTRGIKLLPAAEQDLIKAQEFYAKQQPELGQYCLDSLFLDLERLKFFAGIHPKIHSYQRMLASSFPFSIYYQLTQSLVIVVAILDNRSNPKKTLSRLANTPSFNTSKM